MKDKPETGRKFLQNTCLIIGLYLNIRRTDTTQQLIDNSIINGQKV